ncbi:MULTISPECIES: LysR family transcriptional regulator [Gammaproteobacteria]|uniref:LysR family transcriptional regulator n=2 Tax=Xanthomonas TaxID=338 RepID=A0ABD7S4C5_XANVA|nr:MULTISPECIES: LysR family transcriptional regulator [Xanthomonas]KGR62277.1 D-alanyl-D-alanine endopeptidase [Xanthomonas vasicola]MCE4373855.1 LysR family transcriptional regulator [Xanthomonas hortorum pv. hederae]MDC8640341.1 LysR family transcriptional regulator [Xanthomonas hortorum pv. hederae]PPU71129.1 LysR family transcriptional regulator [Xanthomonas hortorum pv. hederae]PUE90653.1 LysR family transcriptional regulator [Xanthomonas hortorum pv. hederae]
MELRHLRCFLAVAEELHFARAAERLHIDQSPLSRTIKELEEDLGAPLFARTTRSTRLTQAGKLFLEHVPRVFAALDQARASVRAAAAGYEGQLRIALSNAISPACLSSLMVLCRKEDPEIAIYFDEVPLIEQIKGLHEDVYDVGFAQSADVGDGIAAEPAWRDPLVVAIPAGHPLLAHAQIPPEEVLRYPLVMGDPQACEGYTCQIERVLRALDMDRRVSKRVMSFDLMMAQVAAGLALALVGASQIATIRDSNIIARPLAGVSPMLTTYLLRRATDPSEALDRFVARVGRLKVHTSEFTRAIWACR